MADVFISYAREDRARAEQVARGLEALGLEVFWDTEVPPGQTWADYIESKLAGCKAVIVLWSENSTKSQWVREEARMGRESGKLIPAMIDASPPPFGFGEVQAADLSTWRGEPNHPDWERLVSAVHDAAPGARPPSTVRTAFSQQPPVPPPLRQQTDAPTTSGRGLNPIVIGGGLFAVALVLVVGAVFVAGNRSQPSNEPAPAAPPGYASPQQPVQQTSSGEAPNYSAQMQARLVQATQAMASQGFVPAAPQPFTGSLAKDGRQTFPLTLMTPGDYRLVGVCDQDCSDLDLYVKAQDGSIVAQDHETDPTPIVPLTQLYAAQGYVEVVMYNCSVSPCFYSVMLYGRQAGAQ